MSKRISDFEAKVLSLSHMKLSDSQIAKKLHCNESRVPQARKSLERKLKRIEEEFENENTRSL